MNTITKDVINSAAIAISNFIKNINSDTPAGDHQILMVGGVPVSVGIKVENDIYTATGKVAEYTVVKHVGYKDVTKFAFEVEERPKQEDILLKIAKTMFGFADHGENMWYDLLCALNHPAEENFSATTATGHRVTVIKNVCGVYDLNGRLIKEIKLGGTLSQCGAALHISRAIAHDMTISNFNPFTLKVL